MITCPECGQAAPDDAKFCDRCGQGLSKSAAPKVEYALAALEPGAVVRGEFRIVEVIGRSAQENRYRAERTRDGRGPERVQLRERLRPTPAESHREEQASAAGDGCSTHEDPAGPHAKTADLKHPAQTPPAPSAGDSAADFAGSNGASVAAAPERGAALAPAAGKRAGAVNASANNEGAPAPAAARAVGATEPLSLDEAAAYRDPASAPQAERSTAPQVLASEGAGPENTARENSANTENSEDLGDLFGRVLALSLTLNHPAFQRATEGFADGPRVYLSYPDEQFVTLSQRRGGLR